MRQQEVEVLGMCLRLGEVKNLSDTHGGTVLGPSLQGL